MRRRNVFCVRRRNSLTRRCTRDGNKLNLILFYQNLYKSVVPNTNGNKTNIISQGTVIVVRRSAFTVPFAVCYIGTSSLLLFAKIGQKVMGIKCSFFRIRFVQTYVGETNKKKKNKINTEKKTFCFRLSPQNSPPEYYYTKPFGTQNTAVFSSTFVANRCFIIIYGTRPSVYKTYTHTHTHILVFIYVRLI